MTYDLAIIGAGWAGFNAALAAKKYGLKTCLIEKNKIGGTCLNSGCIPTKTFLQSAKVYSIVKKSKIFGIEIPEAQINFGEIQARKDKIITQAKSGIEFMLRGVDIIRGEAIIVSCDTIEAGGGKLTAKSILVASGSKPAQLKTLAFDGKKVISSDDILNLKEIPKSLLIIGGGVIGCEFAGFFSALGCSVTIAEKCPNLLPGIDKDIAQKLEQIFKKKGIKINTAIDASGVDFGAYDSVLLSVGRIPDTQDLGLQNLGVVFERNAIKVDEYLRTNISNIYAAGDSTGKVCLAHFAGYQGKTAAFNIAHPDSTKKCDNEIIPNCIFTDPEIASVGLNEQEALKLGFETVVKKFDFLGSGMARILDETEGFIKIVSDKKSERILGCSIIGPKATELIGILTVSITNSLSISNVRDTIFAHPTISEAIEQAL